MQGAVTSKLSNFLFIYEQRLHLVIRTGGAGGGGGGGITLAFRDRAFTFSIKFLWRVTYNGPYGDASPKKDLFQASGIRKSGKSNTFWFYDIHI